ncbi:MAG TPA: M28 family peptidase [Vicinamibacterales bacterium]|nr:M28 family peptidase [Vicinamibacterales bacterium]
MRSARLFALSALALVVAFAQPWTLLAQAPTPSKVKFAAISEGDMREFLGYLASDALQGRQIYTEGYGLAASYIAEHLRQWGLKPMGDDGTYFQSVKNRGYRITRNSSLTVEVNGQSRTFKHGEHVTFAANSGGKQTLTFDGVEFVGYGIVSLPNATSNINYNDFAGRDVKGKAIMWMAGTPAILTQGAAGGRGRAGGNRANYAIQTLGASVVFGYAPAPAPPSATDLALQQAQDALTQAQTAVANAQAAARGGAGRGGGRGAAPAGRGGAAAAPAPDVTTVRKVDGIIPPVITGDDEFYEFVFGASGQKFADIKAKAEKGENLAPGPIRAKVTVNIDNTYEVISTQLSKNVVGMIEGSDPKLKDTYVLFGAHLDHVGYRTAATAGRGGGGGRGAAASGPPDLIFNGADDDGSGSTALLGIAKAFATGIKPKRSVIIVWHTGEESGLLGSQYMADFPVVPLDKVQAQFNIDMIGRNRDDDPGQANTVFVIGADRISTDLHNLVVDTNATLTKPLKLDYEYNDPSDPNSFYTRSDHYSYAAKGIPIAFFFTGTHPDYHGAGDHPDKILYPKLTAIAQMVYQAGFNAANSDRTLTRDNKGPRSGRGFSGRIDK